MKWICTAAGLATLGTGASVSAQENAEVVESGPTQEVEAPAKPQAVVVARDDTGKATRVRVGEREYAICSETVQDSCINARSAGFDWGTQPLDHWPGQTATSLKKAQEQSAEEADNPADEAPEETQDQG